MSRSLIICCDGTNNQLGLDSNTNVLRLAEASVNDGVRQIVYYDPGVGTMPEPGLWTKIGQTLNRWWSLAFGTGLIQNVQEAYTFLMNTWHPGDRVFLFGFSRGAYTVRVLAGLLHTLGLLPPHCENQVPYLLRLYGGTRGHCGTGDQPSDSRYWRLCNKYRGAFARTIPGQRGRRFLTHFLGVWDTVSSVGWVWNPKSYPYTAANPSVDIVRHAVALDERRWFFRQNLFKAGVKGQDLVELWFPGAHADVGGGYQESQGGLWRCAFQWMLDEAQAAGLLVNSATLRKVLSRATLVGPPWAQPLHESLTWKWWPAELVPKMAYQSARTYRVPRLGLWGHRSVPEGALIASDGVERIRSEAAHYSPANLSASFLRMVREEYDACPSPAVTCPYRAAGQA
jgi:uncharacterized protein (DUF2235 family)